MFVLRNEGYCYCCDKKVFFSSKDEWLRDNYACENCGSIPRERALTYCIETFFPNWKDLTIHESSPINRGASLKLKNNVAQYSASHYFKDHPLGESHESGFINQDLEKMTFVAESFDLFITQDVMEHIFNPAKAFSEIARILKPGGAHIFTVPLINKNNPSETWAVLNSDGSVSFVGNPEYHDSSIEKKGSIVTMHWGYDITNFILEHSGLYTTIVYIDNIDFGIRAEYIEVLISRKLVK